MIDLAVPHYDTDFGPLDECPTCGTRTEVHAFGCADDEGGVEAVRLAERERVLTVAATVLRPTDMDHLRNLLEAEG